MFFFEGGEAREFVTAYLCSQNCSWRRFIISKHLISFCPSCGTVKIWHQRQLDILELLTTTDHRCDLAKDPRRMGAAFRRSGQSTGM